MSRQGNKASALIQTSHLILYLMLAICNGSKRAYFQTLADLARSLAVAKINAKNKNEAIPKSPTNLYRDSFISVYAAGNRSTVRWFDVWVGIN